MAKCCAIVLVSKDAVDKAELLLFRGWDGSLTVAGAMAEAKCWLIASPVFGVVTDSLLGKSRKFTEGLLSQDLKLCRSESVAE